MSDMFRLSPLLQVDRTQRYLSNLRERIATTESAAMTGLAITSPSDAPHRWQEIFGLEDEIEDQSVYRSNAESTRNLLEAVDGALETTGDLLDEAREIAVTFSSELLGATERAAAADHVDALIKQVVNQANTDVVGRYVFAGTNYATEPYDPVTLAYNGSTVEPTAAVAEGMLTKSGFVGTDAFGTALTTLTDLATALRTGTHTDVADQLDPLELARIESGSVRQAAGYSWLEADDAVVVSEEWWKQLNEMPMIS